MAPLPPIQVTTVPSYLSSISQAIDPNADIFKVDSEWTSMFRQDDSLIPSRRIANLNKSTSQSRLIMRVQELIEQQEASFSDFEKLLSIMGYDNDTVASNEGAIIPRRGMLAANDCAGHPVINSLTPQEGLQGFSNFAVLLDMLNAESSPDIHTEPSFGSSTNGFSILVQVDSLNVSNDAFPVDLPTLVINRPQIQQAILDAFLNDAVSLYEVWNDLAVPIVALPQWFVSSLNSFMRGWYKYILVLTSYLANDPDDFIELEPTIVNDNSGINMYTYVHAYKVMRAPDYTQQIPNLYLLQLHAQYT